MRQVSFILLLSLLGCSAPQQDTSASSASATPAPPAAAPTPAADSGPEQAVRRFLRWYAARMDSPDLYEEFVAHADTVDDLDYAVDFKATEAWLTKLKRTGMFSEAYADDWRQYFRAYADTLRRNPQNDGPPAGFDYDFFMFSQEPDAVVQDLQAGTFQTQLLGSARARVRARGPRHDTWQEGLDFVLSRTPDQQWQIDSISNTGQVF